MNDRQISNDNSNYGSNSDSDNTFCQDYTTLCESQGQLDNSYIYCF